MMMMNCVKAYFMKYVQEEKDEIMFLLPYYKQNTNTIQEGKKAY